MFLNFHLAVIIPERNRIDLLRVPLSDDLQKKLSTDWQGQYKDFVDEIQEIDFDPGYKPNDHERFCEFDYELPEWLANENSLSASNLDKIDNSEKQMDRIKGIVAFTRNEHNQELMLFQNFKSFRIIKTGSSLVLQGNTYTNIETPGFILDKKLSAIYNFTERKLLFHSFHNVNLFLPLFDYFRPASKDYIRRILNHERLAPEDPGPLATNPSRELRTRFAMLERSKVLDKFTALDIRWRSKEYGVPIQLSANKKKIVFPSDKSAAKKLLQFLNDEIFRGPITGDLYETNSKKKVDL